MQVLFSLWMATISESLIFIPGHGYPLDHPTRSLYNADYTKCLGKGKVADLHIEMTTLGADNLAETRITPGQPWTVSTLVIVLDFRANRQQATRIVSVRYVSRGSEYPRHLEKTFGCKFKVRMKMVVRSAVDQPRQYAKARWPPTRNPPIPLRVYVTVQRLKTHKRPQICSPSM